MTGGNHVERELLLAMATGTGKTKMAIAMIYRLLNAGRFRRVLFLVDRYSLGEQAAGAFDLFIGVNALDYSGYPDCRPSFIAAFEAMARDAT